MECVCKLYSIFLIIFNEDDFCCNAILFPVNFLYVFYLLFVFQLTPFSLDYMCNNSHPMKGYDEYYDDLFSELL